jgi:hypothetical protein
MLIKFFARDNRSPGFRAAVFAILQNFHLRSFAYV